MSIRPFRIKLPPPSGDGPLDQWRRDVNIALDDVRHSFRTTDSSTSFGDTDQAIVQYGSGTVVSLPPGTGSPGRVLRLKNRSGDTIFVNVVGGGTIDSTTTRDVGDLEGLTFLSESSVNWGVW